MSDENTPATTESAPATNPAAEAPSTAPTETTAGAAEGHNGKEQEEAPTNTRTDAPAARNDPPAGTTTPRALFDLDPKEEKKPDKSKSTAKAPASTAGQGQGHKKIEPKKYAAGTEVRYQGHTFTLQKEMSAREVLEWISEDDFPELAYEDVELRHDEKKNRLVPVRKAQKKGLLYTGGARA